MASESGSCSGSGNGNGSENGKKVLCFQVQRQQPIVVTPCAPTPTELLPLSSVDARFRMPLMLLHFYRRDGQAGTMKDPRKVIKEGLAKVLVPYYPMAGRLAETPSGKLCVDCKAQGVLFIEAEADVRLADFGDLKPPIPCREELLCSSNSMAGGPLLAIQVTMLKCGGFIVGSCCNHVMCDGAGMAQFLKALADFCRGAEEAAVAPIWERSRLMGPLNPPRVNSALASSSEPTDTETETETEGIYFGWEEESFVWKEQQHLRRLRSAAGAHATTFEAVGAWLMRAWTRALALRPEQSVRLQFLVESRRRVRPAIPEGYYGNALVPTSGTAEAGQVCGAGLDSLAGLIRRAKDAVDDEYVRSTVDSPEMHHRWRPPPRGPRVFLFLEHRHMGFDDVDLGWGRPAYGGVPRCADDNSTNVMCLLLPHREEQEQEQGIKVAMRFPSHAMAAFRQQLALDGLL